MTKDSVLNGSLKGSSVNICKSFLVAAVSKFLLKFNFTGY